MSFLDITKMCLDSLKRRKGRTILTILGVFIGCVSIIVMISIGAGMQESYDIMLNGMGDVTIINVYGGNENAKLNEEAAETFRQYDGVQAVMGKTAMYEYELRATTGTGGRYDAQWLQVACVDTGALDDMGFELLEGRLPEKPDEVVVGEYFAYAFRDTLVPEWMGYRDRWKWDENGNQMEPDDPFFNPMNMKLNVKVSTYEENPSTVTRELTIVGILKEDNSKAYETSDGVFFDIDLRTDIISELTGKMPKDINTDYSEMVVKAYDIKQVTDIEDSIKELGYYTSSMQSIRESLEAEARQIELMLGGLGAISLLVAAIGITNTMTMSITERTREIGIMKALGCYVRDIRTVFLMEAGGIGLVGGVAGLLFSFLVSIGINLFSFGAIPYAITWENIKMAIFGSPDMARMSVITVPLMLFAIVFSFGVGLISGYQPANKAVKIEALEAIRSSNG